MDQCELRRAEKGFDVEDGNLDQGNVDGTASTARKINALM